MRSAATADGGAGTAGVSPRPPSWPVRSGTVPAIADGYIDRVETAHDLTAALRPGMMVALVSQRSGDAGQTGSGPASRPASGPGQRTSGPGQRVSGPGQRTSGPGQRASGPGQAAGPTARDWLRSTGKTQLAVALAESLWHARELDLLVWIDASSRASVLSGYAAATALVTGRDQATSCESVATQFLSWLAETSHSWSSSTI
jgi:hypothetical protein